MNSTETAKLRVEIEGDDADKTLLSLKSEAKEINKALRDMKEAGEEGSEAWKDLKNRQKDVNDEMKDMVKNLDLNDASMTELNAKSRLLNRELKDLKIGSDEWIDKMKEVQEVDQRLEKVRKEVKGLKDDADEQSTTWGAFKGAFMGAFTFDAIKEAASAIVDFGSDVLEITAKFEKYNAILATTLGSTEAGAAAFQMIQEFAAKTNFGVDELTESYIKMANRGLRPGQDEMMKLADVANSTGKPMGDLVEAMNDINNTDRWNEFGIKAQTNGDKVSLTFKGVTETVDRTEAGVLKAITAFGEMDGVMGMTAKISDTLDGQLSNLDDNFDRLKTTIGGDASNAFKDLVKVGNQLIDAFIDIWKGTAPVRDGIGELVSMGGRFGQTLMTLVSTLFGFDDKAKATSVIVDAITLAFRLVGTMLITGVSAVQLMADGLSALMNKGKEVANFFGASFKINPTANFDTLVKNFDANFKALDKIWSDTETKREATSKKADTNILASQVKTGQTVSAEAKKEAEKRAKDHEKAEEDSQKKIADMKVKAIADEQARKIAEINLQYERETAAIQKSMASDATKNTQMALLATQRETAIDKVEEDFRKKKEKETTEVEQKLDALKLKMLTDDSARKIAELTAQAARDTAYINKHVADEAKRAESVKLINDKLTLDVEAVKDKHRADEQKKNDKLRADEQKATQQLFDNEFKAFVAQSDAKLMTAKDNAEAIYQAKSERLQKEYEYNKAKLEREASEEKAKNQALIEDADKRAAADKAIDDRLAAQKTATNVKFEADKTKLLEENNAKRKANNDAFFKGLDAAMNGDYTLFMNLLNKKLANEKAANQQGLQDFTKKGQTTLSTMASVVSSLQTLNKKYLDSQLANIKKEQTTQLASWEAEYKAGKINKDTYEKEVAKINAAAAQKEKEAKLQAFKREQALNISMAIINGAQAALKSLAMLGWPLGLIGAAVAAVTAGIQIAMIKNQQPPSYAKGGAGYVRNAGVVKGDRHGATFGQAGISMVNRRTGEEVGEMEGDEPFMILSRNTYKNNKKTVDMLLHSSLHRNGAAIHGEGGTSGDYVGNRPAYRKGGVGGKKMYLMGGYDELASDDGGGGGGSYGDSGGGGGSYGTSGGGYSGPDVADLSGVESSPEVSDAADYSSDQDAEIEKSQKMMEDIAINTENTTLALTNLQKFLAGDFLTEVRWQNSIMQSTLTNGLNLLVDTSKNQTAALVTEARNQTGVLHSEQQNQSGHLARIAAKDLSVSVQTFVSVHNQISVIAGLSNFK